MVRVTLLYFASMRDASGVASEVVQTDTGDLRELYRELQRRHGFTQPVEQLRVAVDGEFADWDVPLQGGTEVAFIPPVSGG